MKASIFSAFLVVGVGALAILGTSCSNPQKEAQRTLEERGYQATVKDLLLAAQAGDVESLELITSLGTDIDSADANGDTALIKAAAAGQSQAVERILGLGADPRHVNKAGKDALIVAAGNGHEHAARMLLSRGGDVTVKDNKGWTALSQAAYNGHAEVVSLLSSQAAAEALDDALLVASFNGNDEVISRLLGSGADINARSPASMTPLMIAADSGKMDAVRVLLQNQANPYSTSNDGLTAAVYAEKKGHEEVQSFILSPEKWGSTPESEKVLKERAEAQKALVAGASVEETLDATVPATRGEAHELASPAEQANASMSGNFSRPLASQVREDSKSKPMAALNGSTIHSRSPKEAPVNSMVLAAYHEEPLPIAVGNVEGNEAEIRYLSANSTQPVKVEAGSQIPGTNYKVQEVTRKFVSSKEGKGRMVDVSRVKVEDTAKGTTHLLVNDISGQASDTYAILTSQDSKYRYVVKSGDVFRTSQPEIGTRDYQVLDIRADGVVIKDLVSEEVVTIARDGVVGAN